MTNDELPSSDIRHPTSVPCPPHWIRVSKCAARRSGGWCFVLKTRPVRFPSKSADSCRLLLVHSWHESRESPAPTPNLNGRFSAPIFTFLFTNYFTNRHEADGVGDGGGRFSSPAHSPAETSSAGSTPQQQSSWLAKVTRLRRGREEPDTQVCSQTGFARGISNDAAHHPRIVCVANANSNRTQSICLLSTSFASKQGHPRACALALVERVPLRRRRVATCHRSDSDPMAVRVSS